MQSLRLQLWIGIEARLERVTSWSMRHRHPLETRDVAPKQSEKSRIREGRKNHMEWKPLTFLFMTPSPFLSVYDIR